MTSSVALAIDSSAHGRNIDGQSVIYLLDRSEELPAFHIYCGEDYPEQPYRPMLHEPNLVLDAGEEGDLIDNASADV